MADDDADVKRDLREFRESVAHEFARVDERFEDIDRRFEQVDRRFEQVDRRFERIEGELVDIRDHLAQLDERLVDYQDETRERFRTMEAAIMNALADHGRTLIRIERRIDTHTHGPEAA